MRIRRVTAIALSLMMIVSVFCVPTVFAAGNYYEEYAAGLDEKAYTGNDLGATYTPEATTFKVWSPSASDAKLMLYTTGSDKEEGAKKILTTDMTYNKENGVWSVTVSGDLKNNYYTYLITNDGVAREVVDIYAQAVGVNHPQHDADDQRAEGKVLHPFEIRNVTGGKGEENDQQNAVQWYSTRRVR